MSQLIKSLLIIVIASALVGGLYYFLSTRGVLDQGMNSAEEVRARTQELEDKIIADLNRITQITLDTQVFSSKEYQALQDTSPQLPPPTGTGRINPFERY